MVGSTVSGSGWSDEVVDETVLGVRMKVYAQRPDRITAVLAEARRWSSRTFIIHGDREVTFGELETMIAATVVALRSRGVHKGQPVAIFAANSPEWVATFFAILAIGAVAVPCNGWWSAEEMANAAAVVEPVFVVSDQRRASRTPAHLPLISIDDLVSVQSTAPPLEDMLMGDEDDPAVVLFTAGTTEFPKGATLSHRALVANLQSLLVVSRKLPTSVPDGAPPSVTLVGLPLFHIGAIQLVLVPFVTGSKIVFLEGRFDPAQVLRLIEQHRVTMFSGVPTMMHRMLASPDLASRDLASLRTVVLGGSPVDDGLLAQVRDALPHANRGVGRTYGLTEAGGVVSTGVGEQIRTHPGSSGRLAPVVEVRIDGVEKGGDTDEGEILVRSPACMDGYWGQSDDHEIDGDRWLRTGDLGRLDGDGYLYITGRLKDVIIRGGENVSALRVESVLRSHNAVLDAAVVGLPDADLGQVVAAVVRPRPGDPLAPSELAAFLRARVASFAVPERWWIHVDPLPTNDAGKILKAHLVHTWPDDTATAIADEVAS